MKHRSSGARIIGIIALASAMAVAGCTTYGGASVSPPPDRYPIEVTALQLDFGPGVATDTHAGVSVTMALLDSTPQLYYRYTVTSQVNGNYAMMPAPPTLYTVYRVPFFKNAPAKVTLRLSLHNSSPEVVRLDKAVCAFDLNGETIFSAPLHAADLVPGNRESLTITGPTVKEFHAQPATGVLTIWLYGVNGDGKGLYKWSVPYQLKRITYKETVDVIGRTPFKKQADQYKGQEERADVAAPGG